MGKQKSDFFNGLVFGFDVGTGSIGYAVRRGDKFLDVGVLICDSEGSDLGGRRSLRRQRRTLRSKKFRRQWFAAELIKLGLPRPTKPIHDPIALRMAALEGKKLSPEELHAALTHLFKRRGYSKVPWANTERAVSDGESGKQKDEEGEIKKAVHEMKEKLAGRHPCQFLLEERAKIGKSPTTHWARKIYWPREVLRDEFLAIVAAQKDRFSKLAESVNWLLYGETQPVKRPDATYNVFFKSVEARNPGVLGLRWPRFDNRGPALDSLQPLDAQGRSLHVVRKNKKAFTKVQWELALLNFRVISRATGKLTPPDAKSLLRLREIWESSKRKKGKKDSPLAEDIGSVKISEKILAKWESEFTARYKLVEGQKPLTPETGAGRARYSSLTLERISQGERFDPPQPILRRKGESTEQALNRYLADIKHPLVRHRLVLFRRLLQSLVQGTKDKLGHGVPDTIVVEAVRSLALSKKNKNELNKRNEQFRKERENAREHLSSSGESASRRAIQRYRLWQEAKTRCPFCLEVIERTALGHGADIEHLVPRSIVDCNEAYNLTVAHLKCNRELKCERTPFAAFGGISLWPDLQSNAEKCFSGRKLEIFLSPDAEQLIEQKADLQHTAYIARVVRHVSLIQLGWTGKDGRDPTIEQGNKASSCFQVTNGHLTSRLRKAWGLNQILHPLPPGKRWDELSEEEQGQFTEKNRGDLRHHALDAMVICCTLPWLAHRTHGATDENGNHGWWTQDEKQRSKAANLVFPKEGQMYEAVKREIGKVVVRHHVSRSNHQQAYATTLYAKKAQDTYVAREVFTNLTPKNLGSIWPEKFAVYCEAAWARYAEESKDIVVELKTTKGCVPESFTRKLCFSHFQRWREDAAPAFAWPEKIQIPIRNVRLISVKDDAAVVPFSAGTRGYVKRTGFKEVQIHLAEDRKAFVPVFVPYWKGDKPISERAIKMGAKPIAVIRRGMVLQTKKPFSTGQPIGKYRVLSTKQSGLELLPHFLANKEEAIHAAGLPKTGLRPRWNDFVRALGYELPHSPSAQSQFARPAEA